MPPPDPVEPEPALEAVDPPLEAVDPPLEAVDPPLEAVDPPVVLPVDGLVAVPPEAGSLGLAAAVVVPLLAGLVVDPRAPVAVPEVVADELPDPLVTTGLGLATGVGSVTRLVAPLLDVEVVVGAAASVVPTTLAVTGRRAFEVLGAGNLGAAPVGAALGEPFAFKPAARSAAFSVGGALGTTGGGVTTGASATGVWGVTGAGALGAVGAAAAPGAVEPGAVVPGALEPAAVDGAAGLPTGATGAGFATGVAGALGAGVAGVAGAGVAGALGAAAAGALGAGVAGALGAGAAGGVGTSSA